MASDALEQALALLAAPARRQALQGRPLPANIGMAIQLAAAPQPLLDETAARLSEPADKLLEAVRFYLQQVLFEDGHDAYRTLGVARSASAATLRNHYHWLQSWLHPDRQQGEWGLAYSERVNWAWTQLRNEATRSAYDARASSAPAHAPAAFTAPRPPPWVAMPHASSAHARPALRRAGTVAAIAACTVGAITFGMLLESKQPVLGEADTAAPTPAPAVTIAQAIVAAPMASRAAAPSVAQAPPDSGATATTTLRSAAPTPAARRPAAKLHAHAPQRRALASTVPRAHVVAFASASIATTPPARLPIVEPVQVAPHLTPPRDAMIAMAPNPVDAPITIPVPQAQAVASATAPAAGVELVNRFSDARIRLADIVAYLRNTAATTPTWVDGAAAPALADARNALWRRGGAATASSFSFTPPDWQFTAQATTLRSRYRIDTPDGAGKSGSLSIDMVWRGNGWRVTRVRMGPAP